MSAPIHLLSTDALGDIRDRLARLTSRIGDTAHEAQTRMKWHQRKLEQIEQRLRAELADARKSWKALGKDKEDQGEWQRVKDAHDALRRFRKVALECEEARRNYKRAVARMATAGTDGSRSAFLGIDTLVGDVASYRAIKSSDGTSPSTAPPTTARASAKSDMSPNATSNGLPQGFSWISITKISGDDLVIDPKEFKKVPYVRMRSGLETLRDRLLPALALNPTMTRDDAVRLDSEAGTDYTAEGFIHPRSVVAAWDAFLDPRREAEVVVVEERADGTVTVVNGRHRLGVARALGMDMVPCRILGNANEP
ncbi:hypothetical protein DFR48_11811 [Ciceribacter lividus]|uniref:Uncharacterized protein n=1 Tax=Ciceribacter lividus TaxID=1197950 RepID=A0A6I7HHH7_9HYPH|nr:hypothetical protein [Ciceribacter lividus]RCW19806.1 hypothetical protein DFR48_11811 [Ciceribacter lividus]